MMNKENFQDKNIPLNNCLEKWKVEHKSTIKESEKRVIIESEEYDYTIDISKLNLIYNISNYYEDGKACISLDMHELLNETLNALKSVKENMLEM